MSKIEIGRYSELLRRQFGMKGTATVAAELSPEISPIVILEGDTDEWHYLKGVRDCAFGDLVLAAPTFTSKWRMRNPIDSGVIAIVEFFEVWGDLISTYRAAINNQTVDLPTAVQAAVLDARWGIVGTAEPAVIVSASNAQAAGPAGTSISEARVLATTPWTYGHEVVLVPGAVLDFGISGLNQTVRATARWRERAFPALEAAGA